MARTSPQPTEFSDFVLDFAPLAARRRYLNMSQERLGKAVGVSKLTILRVEKNQTSPSKPLIVAIARALGVPEHHLYTVRGR